MSSVVHSGTDRFVCGNPGDRRRFEDLKSRRGNVVLAQLAERDETRVLRVRARERIPSDGFTDDIDQDVVPANLRALKVDEVPNIEDADRPHVDRGLLQGLADRGRLDRLANLQRPARQAPSALARLSATINQQHGSIPEHDRADRGNRTLRELVPRRHSPRNSMRAINPTSERWERSRASKDRNRRTCAGATRTGGPRSCAGSATSGCRVASAGGATWGGGVASGGPQGGRRGRGSAGGGGGAPLEHVRARTNRRPA